MDDNNQQLNSGSGSNTPYTNYEQTPPPQYPAPPQPYYQQYPPQQHQYPNAGQWPHMTLGNWIVTQLLLLIPIANIILIFMWAFGRDVNPSKKTYFQAQLIFAAIGLVLGIIIAIAAATAIISMFDNMTSWGPSWGSRDMFPLPSNFTELIPTEFR